MKWYYLLCVLLSTISLAIFYPEASGDAKLFGLIVMSIFYILLVMDINKKGKD